MNSVTPMLGAEFRRSGYRPASDAASKRSALIALFFLFCLPLTETSPNETGLSKGPANPADIGNRCAVMAGREDRAYLNCPEPGPASQKATEGIRIRRPYTDRGESGTQRYAPRSP